MKMKKVISALLATIMAASLLAGCGGSGSSTETTQADTPADTALTEEGEPEKVSMELLTFDAVPADIDAVEAAINELTIPKIGVEVELYPMGFMDHTSQIPNMIAGGDDIDLVINVLRTDFLNLVNKNMVLELDDLLEEYGQGIKETAERAIPGGYVNGTLYGIPSVEKYGQAFGILMSTEALNEVGFEIGVNECKTVTLEEVTEILAKMKEKYPDKTLIHMAGGGGAVGYFNSSEYVDELGADYACGGIMGIGADQGSEIVNVFATEEYADFCQTMYEWNQAGYINADCVTNQDPDAARVAAGEALGYFMRTELDIVPSQTAANGVDMSGLVLRDTTLTTFMINTGTWSITNNCENPEAAMKLMNMLWTDPELIDLVYYGIEGQDYRLDENGCVTFLEGQNAQTVGYRQWFGCYGNVALRKPQDSVGPEYPSQLEEFNASTNEENTSKYLGYSFNPEEFKTEYAAVNDVIMTYKTALECGAVDPASKIPEFVSALETAGINKIIEANQAELDAWIAEQQ